MIGMPFVIAIVVGLTGLQAQAPAAQPTAAVTVKNPIDLPRPSETIVLSSADLQRLLAVDDVRTVQVRDEASGQPVLAQAIDLNDDGKFEQLIFQADLLAGQTRRFSLVAGPRQVPRIADFKAYGRFVRERRDDFAWENDRIAHRMYGAALETWAQEPLTSSAVDVWAKRVRRLVINDWYMVDDYHQDNGTGGDFYSAGKSRGCGGNGIWTGGRLYPSANFRQTRVVANGPIRVMFDLVYDAWDAAGQKITETKRITLDAGQNLDRFESRYTVNGAPAGALTHAIGIKKNPGASAVTNAQQGTLRTWEAFKGDAGHLGCAVVVDPTQIGQFTEDDANYLAVVRVPAGQPATYYAGFGWDKSGDFAGVDDWDRYLAQFARRLQSPVEVSLR